MRCCRQQHFPAAPPSSTAQQRSPSACQSPFCSCHATVQQLDCSPDPLQPSCTQVYRAMRGGVLSVAVKVIHRTALDGHLAAAMRQEFMHECAVLRSLNTGPNILQFQARTAATLNPDSWQPCYGAPRLFWDSPSGYLPSLTAGCCFLVACRMPLLRLYGPCSPLRRMRGSAQANLPAGRMFGR